ncbi:hypothetical protein ABN028_07810 [Actinopolymorpha sp. B17G11]|uniref:hypothetical protein n=1 Tax=Actinopolymorpha sp. B17G11 TaxID=3160861 RepID=UPI0032E44D62
MTVLGQLVRGLLVVVGLALQVLVGLQMFLSIDFGPAELTSEQRDLYPWIGLGFEIAAGALAIGAVAGAIRRRGRAEVVPYDRTTERPAPQERAEAGMTETTRFPAPAAGTEADAAEASGAVAQDRWPADGDQPPPAQAIGGAQWQDRAESGRPSYGEPVQSGGSEPVGQRYGDAGRADASPSWSGAEQPSDAGRGVGEWSRRGQGVGEWLQSDQRRVGEWSSGQPAAQPAAEWPARAGQSGQAGQAGQSGQAGQVGQSGQAGQVGQSGQAGQAGQVGQQGGVAWQAHPPAPAGWPAQQSGGAWTSQPGQQGAVAEWPNQPAQQSVAEWSQTTTQQAAGESHQTAGEWPNQSGQQSGGAWSTQPTTQPVAEWPNQPAQQSVAEWSQTTTQQTAGDSQQTAGEWPSQSGQQGAPAEWTSQPGQQPATSGWSDDAASKETSDLPDEASRSGVGDWFSEPPRPIASDPPTEARPAVEWTSDPARHGLGDWPGEWPFDRPGDRPGDGPDQQADRPTDGPGDHQGEAVRDDRTGERSTGQQGNGSGESPRY